MKAEDYLSDFDSAQEIHGFKCSFFCIFLLTTLLLTCMPHPWCFKISTIYSC